MPTVGDARPAMSGVKPWQAFVHALLFKKADGEQKPQCLMGKPGSAWKPHPTVRSGECCRDHHVELLGRTSCMVSTYMDGEKF